MIHVSRAEVAEQTNCLPNKQADTTVSLSFQCILLQTKISLDLEKSWGFQSQTERCFHGSNVKSVPATRWGHDLGGILESPLVHKTSLWDRKNIPVTTQRARITSPEEEYFNREFVVCLQRRHFFWQLNLFQVSFPFIQLWKREYDWNFCCCLILPHSKCWAVQKNPIQVSVKRKACRMWSVTDVAEWVKSLSLSCNPHWLTTDSWICQQNFLAPDMILELQLHKNQQSLLKKIMRFWTDLDFISSVTN